MNKVGASYGWKFENGELVPDKKVWDVVKDITLWKRCGWSYREIITELARLKINPPQGRNGWNINTIRLLIERYNQWEGRNATTARNTTTN